MAFRRSWPARAGDRRASADGVEHIRVQKKYGPVVTLSEHIGADAEDAPTLVAISATQVLVAYARREDETTRLRAAIVDVDAGTAVEQALIPTPSGFDAEHSPSLTSVGSGDLFLAWTAHQHILQPEDAPEPGGDDTFLQKLVIEDGVVSLTGMTFHFPEAQVAGTDQRRLRLAAKHHVSGGSPALFLAWEDDSPPIAFGDPRPDVGFTLLPYPILDLGDEP